MDTVRIPARSMYHGTVVALITTANANGSDNLAPISSVWSGDDYLCLGIGSASQTAENLRSRPRLAVNLPHARMWPNVEALSGSTGRVSVPVHKLSQFRFSADKFAAAALGRATGFSPVPAHVSGCPLQIEACAEAFQEVADHEEGFLVVLARMLNVFADDSILDRFQTVVSPRAWEPLIFSFRSYRSVSHAGDTPRRPQGVHEN